MFPPYCNLPTTSITTPPDSLLGEDVSVDVFALIPTDTHHHTHCPFHRFPLWHAPHPEPLLRGRRPGHRPRDAQSPRTAHGSAQRSRRGGIWFPFLAVRGSRTGVMRSKEKCSQFLFTPTPWQAFGHCTPTTLIATPPTEADPPRSPPPVPPPPRGPGEGEGSLV